MNLKCNNAPYGSEIIDNKQKVLNIWREKGLLKNPDFIKKLMINNNIYGVNGKQMIENMMLSFTGMCEIMQQNYGENWDVVLKPSITTGNSIYVGEGVNRRSLGYRSEYKLSFIILYPEITITNREPNKSHLIKDLIVQIHFNERSIRNSETGLLNHFFCPLELHGCRLTYSAKEYIASYSHSHLKMAIKPDYYNEVLTSERFCTGSDTEINNLIIDIQETENHEDRLGIFELYLNMIDTVVKWESLEGTPYIKFETINRRLNKNITNISYDFINTQYNNLHYLIKTELLSELKFGITNDKYVVNIDDNFDKLLVNKVIENEGISSHDKEHIIVTKDGNSYYGYKEDDTTLISNLAIKFTDDNNEPPYIFIQGRKIYFKVEEPIEGEENTIDLNNYQVHPLIINKIENEYNKLLFQNQIRKSAIEAYYQPSNA